MTTVYGNICNCHPHFTSLLLNGILYHLGGRWWTVKLSGQAVPVCCRGGFMGGLGLTG